ncbi:MAG TPA: hypothetical protein EYP53_02065 [Candidatus Latescibacteria bacterium]|nr:hypothetical protein [Candidatus Latescibacterota bacterium]
MRRIIKKYPNRKMYDTKASRPVTLAEIASLIAKGDDVRVIDHQTGDDLTTVTLAQIMLHQERRKRKLISLPVLLRELVKEGRSSMLAFIENSLLTSVESIPLGEEGAEEMVRELMRDSKLDSKEGQRLLERFLARIRERKRLVQEQIESRIQETVARMDVASRKELSELRRSLVELTRKVDTLMNVKAEV